MTRYELYIHACKFAVNEQMVRGNITFTAHTGDEVTWIEVKRWLDGEQERAEWLKSM